MHRVSLPLVLSFLVLAWAGLSRPAHAGGDLDSDLGRLGSSDTSEVRKTVERLAERGDAAALPALQALGDGTLRVDPTGHPFVLENGTPKCALAAGPCTPSGPLTVVEIDNALRRTLASALATLRLSSPDREVRLAAASELEKRPSEETAALLRKAMAREKDGDVRTAFELALAHGELASSDPEARLRAISVIDRASDVAFKSDLERLVAAETDPRVKQAGTRTLGSLESKAAMFAIVGDLFYGLSLGSVLLLAALGLAITFGLMRVINMAHGEMLMLGAYATFAVQGFFDSHFSGHRDLYLLFAVPVAFAVTFAVGVALERLVIRHLYGRPLETLLATWGISLILIQTVRTIYGAQNVTVENPSWLSGGVLLLPSVVLTYSRLAVILFSALVVLFTWIVMNGTKLGLELRAVVQNREMAASLGIATRRVDMWTFGMGSGIAGLGGVALSQLGNVGPELGQGYIVDSFMVVVLGGVGKLLGTVVGAVGLGIANKLLEPAAGAVLGKILILGFIILFVQKRPQGIFALKGRFAEVS